MSATQSEYLRPKDLRAALEHKAATPDARFIAGGTDLLVHARRPGATLPQSLISLRAVAELNEVTVVGATLRIGAAAPLTEVARHPVIAERLPALVASIDVLGSRQIRNVATLGGNLCNASPAADTAPPLLVHDARVELQHVGGRREVPLVEFFRGPGETAIEANEVMTAVLLELPPPNAEAAFERKGRVRMDLAIAIVAGLFELDGSVVRRARVAAGAVAPLPLRLTEVEERLTGSELDDDVIAEARRLTTEAISPISDLRSSADYRRYLTGVFVERMLHGVAGSSVTGRPGA